MSNLTDVKAGVRVFNQKINSCAYADDVNLLASTCTGLQLLVDQCVSYAKMWRFKFGIKKTKVMTLGKSLLVREPSIKLDDNVISSVDQLDILGVSIDNKCSYKSHIDNRISSCRKSLFKLSSSGMSYPGLHTNVKCYLWNTVGAPTLLYGTECIPLSDKDIKKLRMSQTNVLKGVLGLSKRNHHSNLLSALGLPMVDDVIVKNTLGFYNRIFNVDSPLVQMQNNFLCHFLKTGCTMKNTMIDKIVNMGFSPLSIAMDTSFKCKFSSHTQADGTVDSLRYLLFHDNYIQPWSDEYRLVKLLTQAF